MNTQCPRDLQRRCNTTDANTCCGGGCDEPCSCTACHPTTVALPEVGEWFYQHVSIGEMVSTLGFSAPLKTAVMRILEGYRKDCRAEIDRAKQSQEKVIVAMRDALKEVSEALEDGAEYQGEILEVAAKVRAALKLAGVTL